MSGTIRPPRGRPTWRSRVASGSILSGGVTCEVPDWEPSLEPMVTGRGEPERRRAGVRQFGRGRGHHRREVRVMDVMSWGWNVAAWYIPPGASMRSQQAVHHSPESVDPARAGRTLAVSTDQERFLRQRYTAVEAGYTHRAADAATILSRLWRRTKCPIQLSVQRSISRILASITSPQVPRWSRRISRHRDGSEQREASDLLFEGRESRVRPRVCHAEPSERLPQGAIADLMLILAPFSDAYCPSSADQSADLTIVVGRQDRL